MEENPADDTSETVIFMYKLVKGASPKSYGFNAAKIAGIKSSVIGRSREYARQANHVNRYAHEECLRIVEMCKKIDVENVVEKLREIHV